MKSKRKRKRLENADSQENVKIPKKKFATDDGQQRHKVVTPRRGQEARGASVLSSEHFPDISSEDKLTSAGKFKKDDVQHTPDVVAPPQCQKAGAASNSSSEYFTCVSSINKLVGAGKFKKDDMQHTPDVVAPPQCQKAGAASDSSSEYFTCVSSINKLIGAEFWKSQDKNASQPPVNVLAPALNQPPAENSPASIHLTHDAPVSEFAPVNEDGTQSIQQDIPYIMFSETSSTSPEVSFPSYSVDTIYQSSEYTRNEKRRMPIFYMRVQTKRGVAALGDKQQGFQPFNKKPRVEETSYTEKTYKEFAVSSVRTRDESTDSDSCLNWEDQEQIKESDNPEAPLDLEESCRAKTPDWLVTVDSGFRCMACCRVFPSLEVLQEHVKHGVDEGFSCRAFHYVLAWLNFKRCQEKKKKKKRKGKMKISRSVTSEGHHGKKNVLRTFSLK